MVLHLTLQSRSADLVAGLVVPIYLRIWIPVEVGRSIWHRMAVSVPLQNNDLQKQRGGISVEVRSAVSSQAPGYDVDEKKGHLLVAVEFMCWFRLHARDDPLSLPLSLFNLRRSLSTPGRPTVLSQATSSR